MNRFKSLWLYSLLLSLPFLIFNSCKTDEEGADPTPTVTTITASDISSRSVFLEASATGTNIVGRGFVYNQAGEPTIENAEVKTAGEGEGSFSATVENLDSETTYFYKAYATNATGTSYGSEKSFTTLSGIPVVTIDSVQVLSPTSITVYATILGASTDTKGIVIGESSNVNLSDGDKFGESSGEGKIEVTINDLVDETTYFVKAYAISSFGTELSAPKEVKTLVIPFEVAISTIDNITSSGAEVAAEAVGKDIIMKGLLYGETETLSFDTSEFTENGASEGAFTATIEQLSDDTEYYVQAYAINAEDTVYSELLNFTTILIPFEAAISAINNVTSSGAEVAAEAVGIDILMKGLLYGETETLSFVTSEFTENGASEGTFTATLEQLSDGTEYYVQAYAINAEDTVYSELLNFTTILIPFEITAVTVSDVTINSANVAAEVNGQDVLMKGFIYGETESLSLSANQFTENGPSEGAFVAELNELIDGTEYFVQAYSYDAEDTIYSEVTSFSTQVIPLTATTPIASAITSTSVSLSATVEGSNIIEVGFVYAGTNNPDLLNAIKVIGENLSGNISANVTGLTSETEYFTRSFVRSAIDTAYSEVLTVTTAPPVPAVSTAEITSITSTTATGGGEVTAIGNSAVTARGIVWGVATSPTIALATKTSNGTGIGAFTSELTNLTESTTYFVRSYATNSAGTAYGNEISFQTLAPPPELPTVTTTAITNITFAAATGGGEVTFDGYATVTARGLVWSQSPNPTINSSGKTTNGSGLGSFTSSLSALTPAVTYYVRAYATNSAGTAYGNEVSFTTEVDKSIPTVTTTSITDVELTSATGGGEVTADGNAAVTARGIVWSTSPNPTISLSTKTVNGVGTGSFTSAMTGLTSNTKYYVRAYATNSEGTAYGVQRTFTSAIARGTFFQGGIVGLVYGPGDSRYVAGENHGLIITLNDQSAGANYSTARALCSNLVTGGYSDWFLPKSNDLRSFCFNKTAINSGLTSNGGSAFSNGDYWSDSIFGENDDPLYIGFSGCSTFVDDVNGGSGSLRVRAVRYF